MDESTSHRLVGFEPDDFLAFLALLGLMRGLELRRPGWLTRAFWDPEHLPLRPILSTAVPVSREEIAKAAVEGLSLFERALRPFSWPRNKSGNASKATLVSDQRRLRRLAIRCIRAIRAAPLGSEEWNIWRVRLDLVASAGGIRVSSRNQASFEPSPLKLPSGQMAFVGAQYDLARACDAKDIDRSLFDAWTYDYPGKSLRLSPEEAQRYAYRATDPSPEGASTELGASALAGLGMLHYTICDTKRRWRMVGYSGTRREGQLRWPIWDAGGHRGASLAAVEALLRALSVGTVTSRMPGTYAIAVARRYVLDAQQGDYGNVARADIHLTHEGMALE